MENLINDYGLYFECNEDERITTMLAEFKKDPNNLVKFVDIHGMYSIAHCNFSCPNNCITCNSSGKMNDYDNISTLFNLVPEDIAVEAIKLQSSVIHYFKNPTYLMCETALSIDISTIYKLPRIDRNLAKIIENNHPTSVIIDYLISSKMYVYINMFSYKIQNKLLMVKPILMFNCMYIDENNIEGLIIGLKQLSMDALCNLLIPRFGGNIIADSISEYAISKIPALIYHCDVRNKELWKFANSSSHFVKWFYDSDVKLCDFVNIDDLSYEEKYEILLFDIENASDHNYDYSQKMLIDAYYEGKSIKGWHKSVKLFANKYYELFGIDEFMLKTDLCRAKYFGHFYVMDMETNTYHTFNMDLDLFYNHITNTDKSVSDYEVILYDIPVLNMAMSMPKYYKLLYKHFDTEGRIIINNVFVTDGKGSIDANFHIYDITFVF